MEQKQDKFETRLKRQLRLAKVSLVLERLWVSSRLFFCTLLFFFALSYAGLWEKVPGILHAAGLVGFLGLAIYGYYRLWRTFVWPEDEDVRAFVEKKNNLSHRPLRSLDDSPAFGEEPSAFSEKLWHAHKQQIKDQLRKLSAPFPRFGLGEGDRYALRSGAILLLFVGLVMAGENRTERFTSAFTPDLRSSKAVIELDVWVTPPGYTRKAPLLLVRQKANKKSDRLPEVEVPVGSQLIARVSGGNDEAPVLKFAGDEQAFQNVDGLDFELEMQLNESGNLAIEKEGEPLGHWPIRIVEDQKPVVKLLSLPEITERLAFRLHYSAYDDYGLDSLTGAIRRNGDDRKLDLKLPLQAGSLEFDGKSYHDLTAHPWAGFTVDLQILAKDVAGQSGQSSPVSFVLPERNFSHPIARALIELRKKLVEDPAQNKREVVIALSAISQLHDSLNNDFTTMMLLSAARGTLAYGRDQQSVDEVIDTLWDAALRLEDGDLSAAEVALRDAERALMEALNSDASDAEIKRLVEELKSAMNDFLDALAKSQENAGDQQMQPSANNRQIDQQDLQNLLDRVDQFARFGARDAARELLSELQDILENLRTARAMPPSAAQQQGQQMLNQLGEMMRRQQNLLDETFRRSQSGDRSGQQQNNQNENGQQSGQEKPSLSDMAGRQEALRQMLGEMMGELGMNGEIPAPFGKAERSMNSARQGLERGDGNGAMGAQGEALEQLRQAAEGLAQQMQQQGQGGQVAGPGQQGQGMDPMGRPWRNGQGRADGSVNIDGNALSRARAIQEELRRRLSDPSRDILELEYFKRLIERFR